MHTIKLLLPTAVLLAFTCTAGAAPSASVAISAAPDKDWQVTYRLPRPAAKLVFARSPDTSRTTMWQASEAFEIVSTPEGEIARRRDGASFAEVSFAVPPRYRHLPKDYAPFSPFGDGGMLFHTGRFFACADACPEDATWSMKLDVSGWRHIVINGQLERGSRSWVDGFDGRNVYLGSSAPVETTDLVAVIDGALPASIREQLERDLPAFMRYFSARLGAVPSKPALFVSYDLSQQKGMSRQGGVLEGVISVHFGGAKWAEKMSEPDFANDLAWHLAHEAAHVYQHGRYLEKEGMWVHEGSAEAFASMALRSIDSSMATYVDKQIRQAETECSTLMQGKSMHEAIVGAAEQGPYVCGLLLNLSIDAATRRESKADGLFAIWREYIERTQRGSQKDESGYLAAIGKIAGVTVAEAVRQVVDVRGAELRNLGD